MQRGGVDRRGLGFDDVPGARERRGHGGHDAAHDAEGVQVVLGATGGYIVGFVLAGALVGRLAELGWDRRIGGAIGATALGTLTIYAVGVPWLAATTGMSLDAAIRDGMLPFLAVDTVKLLAAAAVFPAAWWVVGRRPSDR